MYNFNLFNLLMNWNLFLHVSSHNMHIIKFEVKIKVTRTTDGLW